VTLEVVEEDTERDEKTCWRRIRAEEILLKKPGE
jgi:hypothetical protein